MSRNADADGGAVGDELARAFNPRQSRKIRYDPRDRDARALVVTGDRPVTVYASGVPGAVLWGVWCRGGVYCDDRALDVGALSSLLERYDPGVVDVDDVPGTARGVLLRRCRQ